MIRFHAGSRTAVCALRYCAFAATVFGVFGCSSTLHLPPAPSPAEIPSLEERVAGDATDLQAAVRLGAAYWNANRLPEAESALIRARTLDPGAPAPAFFLGLTYEEMGRYADARREYTVYLEAAASEALRAAVRDRLVLLARSELESAVRAAVASEAELASTDPVPGTVGLFPFLYTGADPVYQPLSRALAEMLVTDLSQTDRLTVLERLRVQLLLDELALADEGMVEPGTAARAGRILGAGQIVQGRLDAIEEALQVDALVVPVGADREGVGASLSDEDALQRLFDLQLRLALELYAALGIELTPAERERVTRRPTENLQALLAFGEGLEAGDGGRFGAAEAHFARAIELDPQFDEAAERRDEARALDQASRTSTRNLARLDDEDLMTTPSPADFRRHEASLVEMWRYLPNVPGRDLAPEVFGTEGFGISALGRVEFIFQRPP